MRFAFSPVNFLRRLRTFVATIGRRRRDRHKAGPRVPRWLTRKMGQEESTIVDDSVRPHTLPERSLDAVADYIKSGIARRIVVLTGAGISTAAGIPDFRSPKTGLYSNLARLNLPYAEAVFDISYFRQHPEPFYVLAKELYPGKFHPTVSHAFIALLARKGLLQMLFTQNIDCLERAAGVPAEKIIEAHGSFAKQRCVECKTEYPDDKMKEHVLAGDVPRCADKSCNGLVKPDIVFFGESLPKAFEQNAHQTALANLVLIIGTSLTVYPFAGLPEMASPGTPRVLFNMERVGKLGYRADDVVELGSCDDGIRKLADLLGWRDELEKLWRSIVGDKEADRQNRAAREGVERVEDEILELTAEVEAVLRFDEEKEDGPVGAGPSLGTKEKTEQQTAEVEPQTQQAEPEKSKQEAAETSLAPAATTDASLAGTSQAVEKKPAEGKEKPQL